MEDTYPEVGTIERDVIAEDAGAIERDVIDVDVAGADADVAVPEDGDAAGSEDEEGEEEYEVASVVGARMEKGKYKYLVSWKGYGPEHNTWEPEENLEHARDVIDAYFAKQPKHAAKRARQSTGTPAKPPAKRGRPSKASQAKAPAEDEEYKFTDTHTDSTEKFKDIADWDSIVKEVDSIERGSNGDLVVYASMKTGERIAQSKDFMYKRSPQAMLRFYEKHLKWRNNDE